MHIPPALINLGETYSALRHPTGKKAIVSECARFLCLFSVQGPGAGRLVAHVHQFGHRSLHAERHLVLLNAAVSFRIPEIFVSKLVETYSALRHPTGKKAIV